MAFLAVYLFLTDSLPLALATAVIVRILDGVDGKIARLRRKKTYIGKLEHSLDMLYEKCWYASFTWYVLVATGDTTYLILGIIWLILDSLIRHI